MFARLLGVMAVLQVAGCASPPTVSEAPARTEKVITDFRTLETAETVAVLVQSDQPLTYTATRQEEPRGVSLHFPGTRLDGLDAAYYPPPNPVVRAIRTSEAAGDAAVRVFLELALDAPYEVKPHAEGLAIVFRKPVAAAPTGRMPALSGVEAPKAEPAPAAPAAAAAATASVLREVHTEVRADGVVIRVIADGTVKTANAFTLENPARIVFDLMGLQSTFKGEQRLPVRSEFVSQVRHHGYPDKVRLVADTEARYLKSYFMEPTADGLQITVGSRKP